METAVGPNRSICRLLGLRERFFDALREAGLG